MRSQAVSSVRVRAARDTELDEVGAMVAGAYLQGGYARGEYLEKVADTRARATDGEVLVAVDADGALLGSVTYAQPPSPLAELSRPNEAEFRMLGVSAQAQGAGVGQALVEACVERARAAGAQGMVLCTVSSMHAAQRLYERLGFVRDPERDWEPAPGVLLLAYARTL